MTRIIALLGNIVCVILIFVFLILGIRDNLETPFYIIMLSLLILFSLNTYMLSKNGFLYLKRKKIEEEIKIQEAENKLRELQNKK